MLADTAVSQAPVAVVFPAAAEAPAGPRDPPAETASADDSPAEAVPSEAVAPAVEGSPAKPAENAEVLAVAAAAECAPASPFTGQKRASPANSPEGPKVKVARLIGSISPLDAAGEDDSDSEQPEGRQAADAAVPATSEDAAVAVPATAD